MNSFQPARVYRDFICPAKNTGYFISMIFVLIFFAQNVSAYVIEGNQLHHDLRRTISVTGYASKSVAPDSFSLQFSFADKSADLSAIKNDVDNKVDKAIAFLLEQGVKQTNIQAMMISLTPWQERMNNQIQHKGFRYTRTITFSHSSLKDFDPLIQGVAKLNPTNIGALQLIVSDRKERTKALVNAALKDAEAKANSMSNTLGVEVIGVTNIKEVTNNQYAPFTNRSSFQISSESIGHPLPGEQKIEARVEVTFEIAPLLR